MRRLTLRFAACLLCALALLLTSSGRADAGLFPDIGNFFFGPPGTPYFRTAYYYPTYYHPANYYTAYYGYGYRAYRPVRYSPSPYARVRTYYPPAWPLYSQCNLCSSCDPCACSPCSLGSCPGGVCATNYGMKLQPTEDGKWKATPDGAGPPKTYKEDETDETTDSPGAPAFPDEESGRLPETGGQHESLRPETKVPQRESAPIKEPEAGEGDPKKKNGEETEDGEKADEDKPAGDGTKSVPPVNVDEKVTWRVLTSRRRLTIRSRFPTPGMARTRVTPNENWVPVPQETKIVSK